MNSSLKAKLVNENNILKNLAKVKGTKDQVSRTQQSEA